MEDHSQQVPGSQEADAASFEPRSAASFQPEYQPYPFALQRFRKHVDDERIKCWSLVALLTLVSLPIGFSTGWLLMMLGGLWGHADPAATAGAGSFIPGLLGAGIGLTVQLLSAIGLPTIIIAGSLLNFQRQYRIAVYDLVFGSMAIVAIDESFGQVIEDARRERWRPNPNQVNAGRDAVGHFNHVAHYYQQYYRVCSGAREIQPPYTIEQNCWLEGPLLLVSACPACMLLYPILLLRIVLMYPAVLAVKTAIYELLSGKHDAGLEQQWVARITRISSGFAE